MAVGVGVCNSCCRPVCKFECHLKGNVMRASTTRYTKGAYTVSLLRQVGTIQSSKSRCLPLIEINGTHMADWIAMAETVKFAAFAISSDW